MLKILAVLFALTLTACGGGAPGAPYQPPVPVGPVAQQLYVPLGDSITAQGGYAKAIAAALGAKLLNLGIGGEFSGPFDQWNDGTEIKYGGVLADEVSKIPPEATLISLYIGTNNAWAFGVPTFTGYLDVPNGLAHYRADVASILAGAHAAAPHAKLVVISVPNQALRAASLGSPPQYTQLIDGMRQVLIDTGLPLVDLERDPAMYDEANFQGPTNVHPTPAGEAAIAAAFLRVVRP